VRYAPGVVRTPKRLKTIWNDRLAIVTS
jgi:hypothetical protein